jgi:hypothetical protein
MFCATWKQRLFYPLVIVSLAVTSEIIAGILLSCFYGMPINEICATHYSVCFQAGHVISKLIFFIFMRILSRIRATNDSMLPRRYWLLIMAVPVKSLIVSFVLAFSTEGFIVSNPVVPFVILIGMLCINVLVFLLYDVLSAQSKSLVEHERAKNLMESDIRRYDAMITQSKDFAAKLHDVRKHRMAVYDLLTSGNIPAAQSYLEKLCSIGSSFDSKEIDAPNAVANSILKQKTEEAVQYGIEVVSEYDYGLVMPIDEVSLCLILGNALDNAIVVCRKLPEGKKKLIEIDIRCEDNRLAFRIANTSNPVKIRNNICATTKNNSMLHGYGLENIKKIVAEKGGNTVLRHEGEMFILSIIFLL